MKRKKQKKIVWDRAFLNESILPVLLCPDDFDLWCTVVVADVQVDNNRVVWNRIGLDATGAELLIKDLNNIGSNVAWFSAIGKFEFDANQYFNCINMFKPV